MPTDAPAAPRSKGRADGRTTRWAGHREQRRQEFVEAALVALERHGPAASVEQVVAVLGLGRQALYRQFEDRADLDRAVAERAVALLVEDVGPHLRLGVDVDASISAALSAYLDHVQRHVNRYRFVRAHDAAAVDRVKQTLASRIALLAGEFLVSTGRTPAPVADTLAHGIVGMADAVIGRWLDDPRGVEREDLVQRLVVMVRGAGLAVAESVPDPR